ncbi:MAG: 1-acyl-sn-glycerol-3-phosphate acyltransferase [Pseudomonadota bacterium]|nr:1-acyl-sn-glycerol-3-phosphate acyltransferase [Pseudomonadota bacterium]
MKFTFGLRLARIAVHLTLGLAICATVFPWAGAALRTRIVRRWSGALLRICRVQLEPMAGVAALGHALVVANHVSWLDIFVINACQPCRFVAKAEIRAWPVFGWLAAKARTVFIARGSRRELRHIFKGIVDALHEGERVAFFPEGTTARQGHLLPFHANLFEAAIDAHVALQPYALAYVDAAGQPHASIDYEGDITFGQSIKMILSGPPVRARLTCLAPIDTAGAHRRDLARAAQDAVEEALAKHRPSHAGGNP